MGRAQVLARVRTAVFVAAAASLATAGWFIGCSGERPITVGSKNFTEQVILGEIVAQHLEHRLGRKVVRKLFLGGTLLAHEALVNGDIDLYPEYSGTALTAILKLPPSSDPATVFSTVKAAYQARFHLHWLAPLGFNNTFAMVIRGDDARRGGITTLSEAVHRAPGWRLGMGYEFQQRPDGLEGFLNTYGLPLNGSAQTMDLGLLYKALVQHQVDMVAANATDGLLSVLDVTVLQDDKGYFPPYQAAVVVRDETLQAHPSLGKILNELAGRFTDDTMRKLNYQVDGEHRSVREVARAFLKESKLVP